MKKKVAKKLAEKDFTELNPYSVVVPKPKNRKSRIDEDQPGPYNISTHKKIELIYQLERNDMKDPVIDLINNINYPGVKVITIHFGYAEDPLGKQQKETLE